MLKFALIYLLLLTLRGRREGEREREIETGTGTGTGTGTKTERDKQDLGRARPSGQLLFGRAKRVERERERERERAREREREMREHRHGNRCAGKACLRVVGAIHPTPAQLIGDARSTRSSTGPIPAFRFGPAEPAAQESLAPCLPGWSVQLRVQLRLCDRVCPLRYLLQGTAQLALRDMGRSGAVFRRHLGCSDPAVDCALRAAIT